MEKAGAGPSEESQIILSKVHVFNAASGILTEYQDIWIEDTQIKRVGELETSEIDAEIIDLTGKFAFPGLFECHTHLSFLTTQTEDEMIEELRDLGGPIDILSQMDKRISSGEILGPKMFFSGSMLEKPPLFSRFVKGEARLFLHPELELHILWSPSGIQILWEGEFLR